MLISNMFAGTFLLFSLGGPEIFVVLVAFLLLFGAKKIPELARGLGKGIREFKDASREIKREIDDATNVEDAQRLDR